MYFSIINLKVGGYVDILNKVLYKKDKSVKINYIVLKFLLYSNIKSTNNSIYIINGISKSLLENSNRLYPEWNFYSILNEIKDNLTIKDRRLAP